MSYRYGSMFSRDYRTLKKSNQKINLTRMILVENFNWTSERDRTTQTIDLFAYFQQGICLPKEMMTFACITIK